MKLGRHTGRKMRENWTAIQVKNTGKLGHYTGRKKRRNWATTMLKILKVGHHTGSKMSRNWAPTLVKNTWTLNRHTGRKIRENWAATLLETNLESYVLSLLIAKHNCWECTVHVQYTRSWAKWSFKIFNVSKIIKYKTLHFISVVISDIIILLLKIPHVQEYFPL